MTMVNVHEAKTHFSELLAAVERGEEVLSARRGKLVAKLVAAEEARPPIRFGRFEGQVRIDPSFYDEMSEEDDLVAQLPVRQGQPNRRGMSPA